MTKKPTRSQPVVPARFPLFSALPISLVAIVVCVIVQLHMAVTFADETPAESEVTQGLELFDPSEQNRFTGRLFSASKNYPPHDNETTMRGLYWVRYGAGRVPTT